MEKTEQFTFRLPGPLKAAMIKAAKADNRKPASWLVNLITAATKEKGK